MRIGTIGTGSIVATMAENMNRIPGCTIEAFYSRKEEAARAFADRFGVVKTYTDLESMYHDPDIDCIYIASPNSLHYEQTKKALLAHKHVICEKPFTPTLSEALELVNLAKEKHLLLFEAITNVYHPNFEHIKKHLPLIGNLQMILCTFCQYSGKYDAFMAGELPNVFNPVFAGGSLMDINLYNIYFIAELLGKPDYIQYFAGKHPNGIDTHGILILQYPDILCECTASKASSAINGIQLVGNKGYMHISPSSSFLQEVRIVRKGESDLVFYEPDNPWFYELQSLMSLLNNMDYEACYKRLDKTLEVVDILERARLSAKLSF